MACITGRKRQIHSLPAERHRLGVLFFLLSSFCGVVGFSTLSLNDLSSSSHASFTRSVHSTLKISRLRTSYQKFRDSPLTLNAAS